MEMWYPKPSMPLFNVAKTETKTFPREIVERMVEAGEIIHGTLENIPKKWRDGYAPGFNRLIELIEKHKSILKEPKKTVDITRAL